MVSSGAERLPKTVYVRFLGNGIDDTQTYTDDIVLDERAPNTLNASMTPVLNRAEGGRWVLRVRARDDNSGLALLGTAPSKRADYETRPFTRRLVISNPRRARFVQVTDRAGNTGPRVQVQRRSH